MGNYQGYQKYKDSGVEWLGDIPEHWEVKRLKNIASCNDEALGENTAPDFEIEYVDISSVDLVSGIRHYENMTFEKAPSRARRKVQDGDTIISTVRTYLKSIAAIKQPPINLIVSTGFAVIRPKININSNYIGYLLQSEGFVGKVVSNSVGVSYPAINSSVLISLPVVEPPLNEQEKIAQFLDYKTKQIDELIKKKETLIEKLDEKRTAIISHAVTKGLDSSVPMKDSGIEWLGDIPEHWKSIRIKFIGDIKYGLGEPPEQLDDGLPIIRATDIYRGIIDGSKVQRVNPDKVPWSRNPELKVGDILVVRSGAYTGDSAIVPDEWAGAIAGYDMVLTPTKAYSKYIALNLLSKHILEGQIYLAKSRAAQPHLNAEELGNTIICLPPIKEQKLISQYLDQKTTQIDQQKAKIKQAIELLKEYRTSLITNAVTGKIDVSQIAIPSPQKPQPQKG
jgi:type I restriction enzyme, S subunit